jgi:four helix bundle protein
MATYNRFEDLPIWQTARDLNKKVNSLTKHKNFSTDFRLVNQIKAAAVSVMDNIAEGFERGSRLEFINFLSYAKGSSGETRSQLYSSFDYGYVSEIEVDTLINEHEKLASSIFNFSNYLNKSTIKGKKFDGRKQTN